MPTVTPMQEQSQTEPKPKPMVTASHLVSRLYSEDGFERAGAREALIKIGKPVVPRLIELLSDESEQVRWEAAKALSEIAEPAAAPALVRSLEDSAFGVRWIASSGLITIGKPALPPLLSALMARSDSVILLRSAHRVVFDLVGRNQLMDILKPVLDALESIEPSVTTPLAAQKALDLLRQSER